MYQDENSTTGDSRFHRRAPGGKCLPSATSRRPPWILPRHQAPTATFWSQTYVSAPARPESMKRAGTLRDRRSTFRLLHVQSKFTMFRSFLQCGSKVDPQRCRPSSLPKFLSCKYSLQQLWDWLLARCKSSPADNINRKCRSKAPPLMDAANCPQKLI